MSKKDRRRINQFILSKIEDVKSAKEARIAADKVYSAISRDMA